MSKSKYINSLFNETSFNDSLDLRVQIEELKGLLRSNDLHFKDKELKFSKIIENYELQISRINDENKQMKERYEKILEAQRKLEKLNSNLEDKLLTVVEKYENEQKGLFEELTLAHSRLIETKLIMTELENEKESYRNDCNIAVNLLQRNPSEFVNHSYNSTLKKENLKKFKQQKLPLDLKERLKSYMSNEELTKLESEDLTNEYRKNLNNSNSFMKLPIFQPTAAAAMMYNLQNISLQQRKIKKKDESASSQISFQIENDSKPTDSDKFCSISLEDDDDASNKKNIDLNKKSNLNNEKIGKISSDLIAQVLRKETNSNSNKSYKLFPYICLRCKNNVVICDSPTQTDLNDLNDSNLRVITGNNRSIFSDHLLLRSKTVASNLHHMTTNNNTNENSNYLRSFSSHHQKCASTDLSSLNNKSNSSNNIYLNAKTNYSPQHSNNNINLLFERNNNNNNRNRLDQGSVNIKIQNI